MKNEKNNYNNEKIDNSIYSFSLIDFFKFNSSHFVVCKNFREYLHGHNYKVSIEIESLNMDDKSNSIINEEILISKLERICKKIHGKMLIPSLNKNFILNLIKSVNTNSNNSFDSNVELKVIFDNSIFLFPEGDCVLIEIEQISSELLSKYICNKLIENDGFDEIKNRGIIYKSLTIKVSEDLKKSASYRITF